MVHKQRASTQPAGCRQVLVADFEGSAVSKKSGALLLGVPAIESKLSSAPRSLLTPMQRVHVAI